MKTLKDLLRIEKETPVAGQELKIIIESVRIPSIREDVGDLGPIADSIQRDGLYLPITVWTDGTLIDGARRLRAHFRLAEHDKKFRTIQAVFVDTIEDAAKRLLAAVAAEEAIPYKSAELCRLWELLRQLDEPASVRRADVARRRGAELRRKTLVGERKAGRSGHRSNGPEYAMHVIAEPFGMSGVTASRLMTIYNMASSAPTPERREQAAAALTSIDAGESSIWANYVRLVSNRSAPAPRIKAAAPVESAPAVRQQITWGRAMPQLEGLTAALKEMGPPNPELTWEQVGPVHARLMVVRRDLEKIIKQMKEINK